ncbi:MAG: cobaltochelatase subunit CobN [Halanaerobiales bacterium]|nr:cobaltochelatase subunit CobN [Halanaerobiales bacterium]
MDENPEQFTKALKLARESDFIFICCHGGFTKFKKFKEFFDSFKDDKKFFLESGIDDEINELKKYSNLSMEDYYSIYRYYAMGDHDNMYNMVLWMAATFKGLDYEYQEPKAPKWEGVYDSNKEIVDDEAYIAEVLKQDKPIIGVLFHAYNLLRNNVEHINELIEKIRSLGATPIAFYTGITKEEELERKGVRWLIDNYLIKDGEPIVDALINTVGFSRSVLSNLGDGTKVVEESIFDDLGVPVLQAMSTYLTLEQWEESVIGLDIMSLVFCIYFPEFDGQIITIPIAYTEYLQDEVGQRYIQKPIEDRVDKICRLALNWARLRNLSNDKKKVAIIFHNMPPRNDSIGCAYGLDTPETVYNIIDSLKENGIRIDYDFNDGQEIIQKIIDGVSNDMNWQTPEKMLEKSVDIIDGKVY